MVIERKLFGCEICGTQYKTREMARSCEDQGMIEPPAFVLSHLYSLDTRQDKVERIYALFMDHVEPEEATYPGHFPEYNTLILSLTHSFKKKHLTYSLTQHLLTYDPSQLMPTTFDEYTALRQLFLENSDLHTQEYAVYKQQVSSRRNEGGLTHPIIYSPLESAETNLHVLVNHEKYEAAARLRDSIKKMEKEILHSLAWPTYTK